MPFLQLDNTKTIDDVLLGTHTDYINLWASVHDEGDLTVPVFLRDAIMKKVTSVISLKDLLDKYNLPGLSMSYDVEFDNWLSWTASKSVDIYTYPSNRNEGVLYELWQQSKDNTLRPSILTTNEGKIITIPLSDVSEGWLKKLTELPSGPDTILIQADSDALFEFERKVAYSL